MSKKYAKLLAAALLGSALVGCSATPEVADNFEPKATETGANATGTGAADSNANRNASDLNGAKNSSMTAAMLRDKVIYFDYDRSDVSAEYFDIVKMNAEYLAQNADARVTIAGHADERGSREYNLALGERRALSVKDALMAQGISANRINVISFGEDMPVDEAKNEMAFSKNRRAEFNY
ncbi:MAG: peptidoglycan-associated lipoprotein Pal [Thiotrichales bacterium]|nr:peptidoglycan-associated lipoprotein Pal [Thiotrichales bacterium]